MQKWQTSSIFVFSPFSCETYWHKSRGVYWIWQDSQINKPQHGHPRRAELPDVNINTGACTNVHITNHIPTHANHILTTLPTTYWPRTNHILTTLPTTYQPHSDHITNHILTTYQPHTDHITNPFGPHYQPHTDHIPATYRPHNHRPATLPTTYWPHTDHITNQLLPTTLPKSAFFQCS